MNIKEFADKLNMKILTTEVDTNKEITGMYVCDLLSWVMSHANKGNAWITVLTNLNIVAVALLTEISCIIIPESIKVEDATLKKAQEQGIVILSSCMSSYDICCSAHELMNS